jgi:hypothetical protein
MVCRNRPAGQGDLVAAGPIMALLSGAGVGAAVGGLTGALIGRGIPEYVATRYEGRIKGVASFYPFMRTIPHGSLKPKKSSRLPAQTTLHRRAKPKVIMQIWTSPKNRMSA